MVYGGNEEQPACQNEGLTVHVFVLSLCIFPCQHLKLAAAVYTKITSHLMQNACRSLENDSSSCCRLATSLLDELSAASGEKAASRRKRKGEGG